MTTETSIELVSPFRYPGSKQALSGYFKQFLEKNGINKPHLFEIFAGGASLSLTLLSIDAVEEVTLVERDPLIYAFWKCLKRSPSELCDRIWKIQPTIDTWKRFQCYRETGAEKKHNLLDLAVAGIFFNRVNYSGILGAKPIGGMSQGSDYMIDCRWNPERTTTQICNIAKKAKRIHIASGDAVAYLRRNTSRIRSLGRKNKAIVYVDPPYYLQGKKLYRYYFEERQHEGLAKYLSECNLPWLTSYDNHPRIRELFDGCKIVPIYLKYTVRQARNADELLITDLEHLPTPPPTFAQVAPSLLNTEKKLAS
jgi:DNA adenine methylase